MLVLVFWQGYCYRGLVHFSNMVPHCFHCLDHTVTTQNQSQPRIVAILIALRLVWSELTQEIIEWAVYSMETNQCIGVVLILNRLWVFLFVFLQKYATQNSIVLFACNYRTIWLICQSLQYVYMQWQFAWQFFQKRYEFSNNYSQVSCSYTHKWPKQVASIFFTRLKSFAESMCLNYTASVKTNFFVCCCETLYWNTCVMAVVMRTMLLTKIAYELSLCMYNMVWVITVCSITTNI